jgi:hypothetical protein
MKNLLMCMFVLLTALFFACKKDTTVSPNASYLAPSLVKDTLINLPQSLITKASTNLGKGNDTLYLLVEYATIANAESIILSGVFFINPVLFPGSKETSNSDGSTTFTYNNNAGEGISLSYYNTSSESWWKYVIDSASYSKQWYYVDNKGTSGETDSYNFANFKSPTVLSFKDIWSVSGNTTSATISFYNNDGTLYEQFVSTSSTNQSGSITVYIQNNDTGPVVKQWYYTWTSTGTGNYIYYQSDGVTISAKGTF